jgi:hypothetical protein
MRTKSRHIAGTMPILAIHLANQSGNPIAFAALSGFASDLVSDLRRNSGEWANHEADDLREMLAIYDIPMSALELALAGAE